MAKNISLGKCECPFKGCALQVPVFKFRQRSDDPKKQRMGGKLYGECPAHGRFIDQEWLLQGVTWQDGNESAAPAASAAQAPAPVQRSPEKAAETPASKPEGFGFFS